ncbi:MAG TPA: MFS transporter [Burkholderiaceae bacterium]
MSSHAALDNPWRVDAEVIGLIGVAHGTSHFFHLLLPPLFPWLIRDFGLSFTQAGFLMTVFFVISGAGQALAGFAVDRFGARPVLFSGMGLLALSGVALGLASAYQGLLAAVALAGAGNSIFHPADFTLLNRRVSASRLGHAFASHGLAGNLGWAAGATAMGSLAAAAGWHAAGFGAALVAAAVLAALVIRREVLQDDIGAGAAARAESSRRAADQGRPIGPFAFLRSAAVWMCFVFFLLSTGAFGILQNFAPEILRHVYGVGLGMAGAGLTVYLLGSTAGMAAGGFIAARARSSDFVVAIALAFAALVALWLASATVPVWALLPMLAAMGFGSGVAGPNRDLLVRQAATARFGAGSFGRVYGFVYSGLDVGLALTPVAFGRLLDAGMFRAALLGIALLQVGALLSALRVGQGARERLRPEPA